MTVLLYISLPLLCILAIPIKPGRGAFALRLVYGIALYEFLLLASGLALGLTQHLSVPLYKAVNCVIAFILAAQVWRNKLWRNGIRCNPSVAVRWLRTRRGAVAILLAVLLAAVFAIQLGFDSLYGTRQADGLWYHIPRVMFWVQQHSFEAWPTLMWEQIGLPVGADVVLGQKVLLGDGWQGIGFITGLFSLGAIACVYLAALDLRLPRWQAVITAILFGSFPAVGLRIWTVNSDMAAAFPVLASYVVLLRVRDVRVGFFIFLILNAIALACKPTVTPLALLLGGSALWQCRHRIANLRSLTLPALAGVLGAALVIIPSYWPVYQAFSDFQGGDNARALKVHSVEEFSYSVALSAGQWMLEPLGYAPSSLQNKIKAIARSVYASLGARLESRPESWWRPTPSPEQDRTGLAAIIMLPLLLAGLPRRIILPAAILFLSGFVSIAGALHYMPTSGRFSVVLLAVYALLWGGTKLFGHGNRRWLLAGLVILNVSVLFFESILYCKYGISGSQPGGEYYYLADKDRKVIADTLAGRPLLVVSGDMDALLPGPEIAFPMQYLVCPANGDWNQELQNAASRSNWLAVVHNGEQTVYLGPDWHRSGFRPCTTPELSTQELGVDLSRAGWQLYKHNPLVDLWRMPETPPRSKTR